MDVRFTDRETDIMNVLWHRGSATAAEVRDRLTGDPAYTTVSTLLRILVDKGHVGTREEGRAHRYYPLVDRRTAGRAALQDVTRRIFDGSTEAAVMNLIADAQLEGDQVERIKTLLDRRRTTT